MRQAGRYLPEYRALRTGGDILDACRTPELAVEITLQPLRRMALDAAILFSDIMVPVAAMGVDVRIESGVGPVVADPIRSEADVGRLRVLDPEADVPFVLEAVRLLRKELAVPLIGFAGAPFTLASYLVEGGPSRDHARTKSLMVGQPELWDELCRRLADLSTAFLEAQVTAGARAVQLFDSWAGALSAEDYLRYVQPHSATVLQRIHRLGVPTIHFGVGTGELLGPMAAAGSDVIGVDWRVDLAEASARIGPAYAVQGNLDPALLGVPWPVLADRVRRVLRSGARTPGHVFNLGHGVPPDTDPDVLTRIVELVHAEGASIRRDAEGGAR